MKKIKITSIILATALVIGTLVWLVWMNAVPSGVYKVVWKADQAAATIGPLVPAGRVSDPQVASDGVAYRTLTSEPVNFDVKVPRAFAAAEVDVKYSGNPKIFEIGGLASRTTWVNDIQPAENSTIDGLKWTRITAGGLILYERDPVFKTLNDFFAKMPATGVLTYRAVGFPEAAPAAYCASGTVKKYAVAFRGATTIKTYLQNEKLNFLWQAQDLNRNVGTDGFTATATLNGKLIAKAVYVDQGNGAADGKLSALTDLKLYTNQPISGVVTIDLAAPDDIVFRETQTTQTKFVFANRLYLADNVGYSAAPAGAAVVTDGKTLSATTAHASSFQTLKVGAGNLNVNDLNSPFTALTGVGNGLAPVISEKGDLRLETAGLFAFTAVNYWRPDPMAMTAATDLAAEKIDYILTTYVPPLHAGLWRVAQANFDFSKLSVADGAVNFTLSLPGKTADQILNVAEIDVVFRRAPFSWNDLWLLANKLKQIKI